MGRAAVVGVGLGVSLSPGQLGANGVSAGWALGNSFCQQAGLVQRSSLPFRPGRPLSPVVSWGDFLWYSLWEPGRASRSKSHSFVWVSPGWSFPGVFNPHRLKTGGHRDLVDCRARAAERCCFCAGVASRGLFCPMPLSCCTPSEFRPLILQAWLHLHPVLEACSSLYNWK